MSAQTNYSPVLQRYLDNALFKENLSCLNDATHSNFWFKGLCGSSKALTTAVAWLLTARNFVIVLDDKESAAYFFNDAEYLLNDKTNDTAAKKVFFFPASSKKSNQDDTDAINVLSRTEVISKISSHNAGPFLIVTYPEAIFEKVVSKTDFDNHIFSIKTNDVVDLQQLIDKLIENHFVRVDFTIEPGQFSVRGGIIDIFSYHQDKPYRIELSGDVAESLRCFDATTQVSVAKTDTVKIVPDLSGKAVKVQKASLLSFFADTSAVLGFCSAETVFGSIAELWEKAGSDFARRNVQTSPEIPYTSPAELKQYADAFTCIDFGLRAYFKKPHTLSFDTTPQPVFNKKFGFLISNLRQNTVNGLVNFICTSARAQADRLENIFADMLDENEQSNTLVYKLINHPLHEGFTDNFMQVACYTDHQIFERYHRYSLREGYKSKQAFTLKELNNLMPGDYITHIDHGIGRFSGLEKVEINGREQEALRIIYKDNDLLYLSIHSLHRIAKYTGKEGTEPVLHKIGSQAWQNLKAKTKKRVKDIAKDLIKLYAKRKATQGFACMPDTYLQQELEASFIYEDTPDQIKATADVKKDLEAPNPMDRLICGDVGFGKTEIAIRAAFKVATESRQVAILVPTTILAWQHFNTFTDRLRDFPCKIDYVSRLKTSQQIKESLINLKDGKTDIIIGTHRLISKDVAFKDLGLLVIDEEQKFGVAMKEKLKEFKVNVDTLTLTATPIPRTLQFSMMGARDLSIINTPPPNRYPIETEIIGFDQDTIKDAIIYEVARKGQVFIVNNRIQNIYELADVLRRWLPNIRLAIGHGQMDGNALEKIMLDFIDGDYDVLLATTIIESGLDIPNVNTMIIMDAHHFGLSDLHQLRGRVGRSNRKAFCYLVCPPLNTLTADARKRIQAIEEFSELGSGLNIAMRDLDIRGAGNLLGGEQSGFISDIGFEMYHRILDEAISELKEEELKDTLSGYTLQPDDYIRECVFESDLEVLIPTDYISNTAERLIVYREINELESEDQLALYASNLTDRFGTVPPPTVELFGVVRLRWLGKKLGMEKIVLKNRMLSCMFVQNQESPFYNSDAFMKILNHIRQNPPDCRMKEANSKLNLYINNINGIDEAMKRLAEME